MSELEKYPLASQSVDKLRSDPESSAAGVPEGMAELLPFAETTNQEIWWIDCRANPGMSEQEIADKLRPLAIRAGAMFKIQYIWEFNAWAITVRPDETTPDREA